MTGLGAALSVFFSAVGSSVASVPAGNFLLRSKSGTSFAPIAIAGVLAIYGTIMAVVLCGKLNDSITAADGYRNFAAGLAVGFACLASGFGLSSFMRSNLQADRSCVERPFLEMEIDHESQVDGYANLLVKNQEAKHQERRGCEQQGRNLKFLSVLVFLEAIGLYGLVVGLIIAN